MLHARTAAIETARRQVGQTMLRAVDYLRVSTEEQAKGYGIAYSGKKTSRYIAKKGWEHVGTYKDEGISGALEAREREDLNRLMGEARRIPRPFDMVVVNEGRAIGRTGRAFWKWVWELQELGISVAVVKKDYDNSTPEGESKMRKDADYAEDERNIIRERTQGGIQEKAEDGGYIGGKIPYGYRVINKGIVGESKLILDECDSYCGDGCNKVKHEAENLRRGRELFVAKRDWRKAAITMNAEGYTRRDGARWGYHSLRQQILSPIVLEARQVFRGSGAVKRDRDGNPINGEPVVINLPPVFTPAEIEELKTAAKRPARQASQGRTYTLSGRIVSHCGQRYVGGGKSRREKQYRCRGRVEKFAGADICTCPYLRAEPIEEEAWRRVRALLGDAKKLKSMADDWIGITAGQRINFEERLSDLDQLIETQEQAIALTLSVASKRVAARKLPRDEAEKELEKAVAPLQTELDSLCESREEVASWQAESAAAGERAAQLVELAEMAHLRLNNLPPDRQSEFMDMLNVVVTVVGDAPQGRTGQPCALAAWFRERGRTVPILTDEAWEKIAPLLTYKSRGVDPRLVMRGILYKVRTDTPWKDVPMLFGRHATLQTYWTRWRESGFWEQAMDALASAEGTQLPGPGTPKLQMQCLIQPLTILESEGHSGDAARRG